MPPQSVVSGQRSVVSQKKPKPRTPKSKAAARKKPKRERRKPPGLSEQQARGILRFLLVLAWV
jgi:hypothetical protein